VKLAERPAWVTLFLAGDPKGQNPVMPRPLAAGIGILSLPNLLALKVKKRVGETRWVFDKCCEHIFYSKILT
jgi:hypothetical protein